MRTAQRPLSPSSQRGAFRPTMQHTVSCQPSVPRIHQVSQSLPTRLRPLVLNFCWSALHLSTRGSAECVPCIVIFCPKLLQGRHKPESISRAPSSLFEDDNSFWLALKISSSYAFDHETFKWQDGEARSTVEKGRANCQRQH